jgi:hypothetical protein
MTTRRFDALSHVIADNPANREGRLNRSVRHKVGHNVKKVRYRRRGVFHRPSAKAGIQDERRAAALGPRFRGEDDKF